VIQLTRERDIAITARDEAKANERKAVAAEKQRRETGLNAARRFAMQAIRAAETGRWAEATQQVNNMLSHARAETACRGFYESIRELSLDEQKRRLAEKFEQIHGQPTDIRAEAQNGVIAKVWLSGKKHVQWLQPLRGMPLTHLDCSSTALSDLSPLQGMALTRLWCSATSVSDLGPLKGMPLTWLNMARCNIRDLGSLRGMPLKELHVSGTRIKDLSPLRESPLELLSIEDCKNLTDLTPLEGMRLDTLASSVEDAVCAAGAEVGRNVERSRGEFL